MTSDEWREAVGARIAEHRGQESVRSAARRAQVDEAVWRQVENGYRTISGVQVPANPRDRNLEAIALAVGLDPAQVFAAVGRTYTPTRKVEGSFGERLSAVEADLAEVKSAVEQLLDQAADAT